ncbi:MAG: aldo/keto reductase [Acidobacteriota bacterium]
MDQKSTEPSRREFIKAGLVGMAGLSQLPSALAVESTSRGGGERQHRSVYRTLGRTGIRVPVVGMGALAAPNLVQAALDAGAAHFDTAHRYGGGLHEAMLGNALKGRTRDSFVIGTKIYGARDNRTGLIPKNVTPSEYQALFRQQTDESLRRLNVDYVDILYLHGSENVELLSMPVVKDVMQEIKRQGKARALGVSIHKTDLPMLRSIIDQKIYDVVLAIYNFRQPNRDEVTRALAEATGAGLGVVAMKVMAGLYWDKERKIPINTKAALKWALQNENVQSAIPGASNLDEVAQDVSVMDDLRLTPEEEADLRWGERNGVAGLFCDQCGRCRAECRNHLDIPTAMRSYMYAYGYRNPGQAKETLQMLARDDIACRACPSCSVVCPLGLPVSPRLRDIARVLDVPDELLVRSA